MGHPVFFYFPIIHLRCSTSTELRDIAIKDKNQRCTVYTLLSTIKTEDFSKTRTILYFYWWTFVVKKVNFSQKWLYLRSVGFFERYILISLFIFLNWNSNKYISTCPHSLCEEWILFFYPRQNQDSLLWNFLKFKIK